MKSPYLFAAVSAFLLLSITIAAPLLAADYNELEARPGDVQNNTRENAETIAPTLFTTPEPAEVFARADSLTVTVNGSSALAFGLPEDVVDVDFFRFSTLGSTLNKALFDIDGTDDVIDSVLALFNEAGILLAYDDDMDVNAIDTGSTDEFDSFIGEIELQPGNYFIAVSQFPNEPMGMECFDSLIRPDGEDGGDSCNSGTDTFPAPAYTIENPVFEGAYKLHISLQATEAPPAPQPKFMPWLPLLLE